MILLCNDVLSSSLILTQRRSVRFVSTILACVYQSHRFSASSLRDIVKLVLTNLALHTSQRKKGNWNSTRCVSILTEWTQFIFWSIMFSQNPDLRSEITFLLSRNVELVWPKPITGFWPNHLRCSKSIYIRCLGVVDFVCNNILAARSWQLLVLPYTIQSV